MPVIGSPLLLSPLGDHASTIDEVNRKANERVPSMGKSNQEVSPFQRNLSLMVINYVNENDDVVNFVNKVDKRLCQ